MKRLEVLDERLDNANTVVDQADYVLVRDCWIENQEIATLNKNVLFVGCYLENCDIRVADTRQFSTCYITGGSFEQVKRIPSHYQALTPSARV
ncbi:hypothetical protein VPHK469_0148 [Vibrio phage K469]